MNQTGSCIEKEALVDYLYGESDADARRRVDAHLGSCARCADEIRSLTAVRGTLETWEPPDAAPGFRVAAEVDEPSPARIRWRPAWALAAAAVLAVAAALIVRPEIELGAEGMVLRIGWRGAETDAVAASNGAPSDAGAVERVAVDLPPAPTVRGTRAGLGAEGGAPTIPGPRMGPSPDRMMGGEVWLQQVRQWIRESEQRQIDRVQEAEQRIGLQRQADMSEMERMFREDQTNDAAARQEILDYLRGVSVGR
jgi:hypothetical protein